MLPHFTFVFLTFLMPLLGVILLRQISYDNCRHLLFILPPLISCAAVALDSLISSLKNKKAVITLYCFIGLLLLEPAAWMIKYHPMQALYFSPVIGGNKGAFGKYEMDYWGFSIKPAIDWLAKNAENATPQKPARVRLWFSDQLRAKYYIAKHPNLKYVYDPHGDYGYTSNWDYSIVLSVELKFGASTGLSYAAWPPKNTVYRIMAGGVPVGAVVKRSNKKRPVTVPPSTPAIDTAALELQLAGNPSENGYIGLSLIYYGKGDFINCILASRKALKVNPASVIAYNNICSAYTILRMFREAAAAGKKALELAPNSALIQNNYTAALNGLKANAEPKPMSSRARQPK